MADVVTKLTNYFHLFDGTSKSLEEEGQQFVDQVFDHHAIFHTPSGDHGYPEYLERVRELLEDGSKAEIVELKMHEKGVEYRVRLITSDGETFGVHSIATVDHGKIVEVNQESE